MSEDESVQKFRSQGNKCFRNDDYIDAISNYKKGLKIDETNPHLNSNIAEAYLAVNDFVKAETHAKIAIIHCRDSAKGYFRAAKASAYQGNKAKAIKYLKEGIVNCKNTKDLEEYHQKLVKEERNMDSPDNEENAEDIPELVSDSDSDDAGVFAEKMRSRSTSRMASTSTTDSYKPVASSPRSVSMSRRSPVRKINKKSKKKKGPIGHGDIANDPTLLLFESIQKEKGIHIQPEQIRTNKRKELNILLKGGSEVMASGLSRKAVEKYKSALDMILEYSLEFFKLNEIDVIVLKYALCIGWIELADYGDIAKAVEYLIDIEDTRASKFPAVFYGLGSAYYKLNRYKVATEHLEKGLLFLSREVKFEVQPWPGTNNVIPETTRSGLEEVLKELLKTCRTYHEPDAICRHSKCISLSSHIIPSDYIFFSDPDFCGFVVVICEEKCKIEYHLGCWKDYKESTTSDEIGKLSEKDFIGRLCPTRDCINHLNERSVIVKIEIIGDDTTIKTSIEAPKTESIKETKKSKKKKSEKISDVIPQEKPKAKNRPKVKKIVADTLQPSLQPDPQTLINSAEELETRLEKLKLCRNVKFGFTDDNWNPKEIFYGRSDIQELDHFLSPEYFEESDEIRAKKDFLYSYFYEFIKSEGPQKLKDVQEKWGKDARDFEGISELLNTNNSVCTFLLKSYRFASIDDYICLTEQLPDTYNRAKTELVEALSFTLTGKPNSVNQTKEFNSNINSVVINSSATNDSSNQNEIKSVKESFAIKQVLPDLSISQTNTNNSLSQSNENSQRDIKIECEDDDIDIDDPDIDTSENQAIKSDVGNQASECSSEYQSGLESSTEFQTIKSSSDPDMKTCSENQSCLESSTEYQTIKSGSDPEMRICLENQTIESSSENQAIESSSENQTIESSSENQTIESSSDQDIRTCSEEQNTGALSENQIIKSDAECENIKSEPENINSETQNIKSEPENINSEKQNIKPELENIKSETESTISESENTKSESENIKLKLENMKSESEDESIKTESKYQPLNNVLEENSIKSSPHISASESVVGEGEKIDLLYDSEEDDDDDDDGEDDDYYYDDDSDVIIEEETKEELAEINKDNISLEDLINNLNPRAGEYKSLEEIDQDKKNEMDLILTSLDLEKKIDHEISENNTDIKTKRIAEEVTIIPLMPKEEGSPLKLDYKKQNWSIEDGQFHPPPPLQCIPHYQPGIVTPQPALPYLGPYMQPLVNNSYSVPQFPEGIDKTTQTEKNFDEEIDNLKSTITKLEEDLNEEKKVNEAAKISAASKLEKNKKKIEELELELNKVKKNKEEEVSRLNKSLKEHEEKSKKEKSKLMEELMKAKSEVNSNEMIRNVISTSGQKVKELEDEISEYQQIVLRMMMETRMLTFTMHKQKCMKILGALKKGESYLSDLSTTNKKEIVNVIQKWETHIAALIEYEINLQEEFKSISKKLGGVTCQDLISKVWAILPLEPDCPNEKMAIKILEEKRGVLQGTTTVFDKDINTLKLDAQKTINDLSVTENKTDRPNTPKTVTENISFQNIKSQNMNVVNKENKKVDENLVLDKDAQENKKQQKTTDLNIIQNGQAKTAYNTAGAPLYQYPYAGTNAGFAYLPSASTPYFYPSQQHYGLTMPVKYEQQVPPVMIQPNQQPVRPSLSSMSSVRSHYIPNENPLSQVKEITSPKAAEKNKPNLDFTKVLTSSVSVEQNTQWPNMYHTVKDTCLPTDLDSVNKLLLEKKKTVPSGVGLSSVQQTKAFSTITSSSAPVITATKQTLKPVVQAASTSSFEQKPAVKQKTGSSYQKLMAQLHKNFPAKTEEELAACIAMVREKNNNSLTGISVPKIISMVDKELKEKASKKQGSMGLDKFGGTAWGGVRESAPNWSKPKDSTEDDCVICYEPLDKDQTTLQCKHSFHTKCIRKWLHNDSICPMCREFTRMVDEFPPLN